MSDLTVKDYPITVAGIDWRSIQKGDVIPAEKVDEMWDVLYGETRKKNPEYVTVNVKDWIDAARQSIGDPIVFRQVKDEIVALTDEQAVGYLNNQAMAGLRKHRNQTRRMFTHIDTTNLSQHQSDQLEVNQARHALIASAADGARRQAVKLISSGAKLPKLMPPDL